MALCCLIEGTAHFSFTDMNFLIPGALARVLYFAGNAPPPQVLDVVRRITQPFLAEHWGSSGGEKGSGKTALSGSATLAALQAEESVFDLRPSV